MFEDHKKTQYEATQTGSKINALQKQIGAKKKAKQNADELLKQKDELQKAKKAQEDSAAEKFEALNAKVKRVGNYGPSKASHVQLRSLKHTQSPRICPSQ